MLIPTMLKNISLLKPIAGLLKQSNWNGKIRVLIFVMGLPVKSRY